MMYREPADRARAELEVDLAAASPEIVAAAVIDGAHFQAPEWVLGEMLAAIDDERAEVVRAGLAGLATLARRGKMPADRRVWRKVLLHCDHAEFAGLAEDVLDDMEVYGMIGARDRSSKSDG